MSLVALCLQVHGAPYIHPSYALTFSTQSAEVEVIPAFATSPYSFLPLCLQNYRKVKRWLGLQSRTFTLPLAASPQYHSYCVPASTAESALLPYTYTYIYIHIYAWVYIYILPGHILLANLASSHIGGSVVLGGCCRCPPSEEREFWLEMLVE